MADDKNLLPDGLMFFNPSEKAPDFVIGTMMITPKLFREWALKNIELAKDYKGEKQFEIQLLVSKAGKLYGKVNDYKAEDKPAGRTPSMKDNKQGAAATTSTAAPAEEKPSADDLPF